MPPLAPAHPADATLAAFGLGKTDDATTDLVSRHLAACPACRRRVASLSADSFVGKLRDAGTPGPEGTDPGPAADGPRPRPPAGPTELSSLAGQYEVRKELGRGGMGVVYLARNTLMDRDEVLKVVSAELLSRPGAVERFLREIQSAARLNHPNVVAAYSALRPAGGLVFAMEYVPGVDLNELVKAAGPLPAARACLYAAQAAAGLQHAHAKGMVHRDIKPSNLILSRADKKAVVKVLDFGLAKVAVGAGDPGLTRQGQMLGTPAYIAPEQATDASTADTRADIYSLGCTLYFLLAGRPPFDGSVMSVIVAHRMTEPTPPPGVPADVWAVVARMMAKNPADRYATPAAAARALLPLARATAGSGGEASVSVASPGPLYEPDVPTVQVRAGKRKPSRRLRTAAIAGALLAVGLGAAYLGGALRVKTPTGVIVVEDVPAGAAVEVDGRTVTLTRNGQAVRIDGVAGGTHELKVTVGGVEVLADVVTVKLGGDPVRVRVEPATRTPAVEASPARTARDTLRVIGDWTANDGVLRSTTVWGKVLFGDPTWTDYDVTAEARQVSGRHGFGVLVRAPGRLTGAGLFVVGNDDGRTHAVGVLDRQLRHSGGGTTTGRIATGPWHTLKVRVRGRRVTGLLDGAEQLSVELADLPAAGAVGFHTWENVCEFRGVTVTDPAGTVLWAGLPTLSANFPGGRTALTWWTGRWDVRDGELAQSDPQPENVRLFFGDARWVEYDYSFTATKTAGEFGVAGIVCAADRRNFLLFDLAGWQNRKFAAEQFADNKPAWIADDKGGAMATDKPYRVAIKVRTDFVECLVGGERVYRFENPRPGGGAVGFRVWGAAVRIADIRVADPAGKVLWDGPPVLALP